MHAPLPPRRRSVWRTTRRALLIGGGTTVGLAVGWALWPRDYQHNLTAGDGEHIINAWLKIGTDGRVTVIVPQAEMGQGVTTALPQILADELGADWRTVTFEPAPLNPIYANRAMFTDGTAALPGLLQGVARWAAAEVATRFELQITGGSTSVRAYEAPLRLAGATARALLCQAAARGWNADWTECDTADGFVIHAGRRVRFAEVAEAAADETPPDEIALRPPGAGTLVGRSPPRLDIPAKVDGTARFGADVRLPGQIYAAIRHGPVNAGLIDIENARQPSILGVTQGPGWFAVTAETWWAARRAADAMRPRWRIEGEPASSQALDAALSAALANPPPLEGAGQLVEARYSVPFLAHAALEPMTATARVTSDRAEVWVPTQSTRLTTYAVARALGLPEAAVTIYPTFVGGGFGRKAEPDAAIEAALIARDMGRPVQLIWTREEDITAGVYRPAAHAHMRSLLAPDGAITAWNARIAVPSVIQSFLGRTLPPSTARSLGGSDSAALEGAIPPYAIARTAAHHLPVSTPIPLGFWRSVGHSYTAFFSESFVDELARAAGRDPLAYRLDLLADRPRHAAVLTAAAERAGYTRGMGVALHESFGSVVAQIAEIDPGPPLRVRRVTCAIDPGRAINPDGVRAQMEGSIVFGLTAALRGRISFTGGQAQQNNFDSYPLLTLADTPSIDTILLTTPGAPLGGVGEPGVPPIAPAVANALAATTGRRLRDLPLST